MRPLLAAISGHTRRRPNTGNTLHHRIVALIVSMIHSHPSLMFQAYSSYDSGENFWRSVLRFVPTFLPKTGVGPPKRLYFLRRIPNFSRISLASLKLFVQGRQISQNGKQTQEFENYIRDVSVRYVLDG